MILASSSVFAQAGRRSSAADPDMKELAAYTLTLDTLNRVDRVTKAMIANVQKDPKYAERIKLSKELAELKKKDEPTEAEEKRIETIEARLEQIEQADDQDSGSSDTLTDMEHRIAGLPPLAAALKQEGMAPREYAKFMMAMMQAGFTVAAKQMTEKMNKPFEMPDGVNPANVKFFQDHEAEIKRMQASYEAAGIK